jgi:hypothetical protein
VDGLQKDCSHMSRLLRNNPYVQSPTYKPVDDLLRTITVADTYYQRGTKQATTDLKRVEYKHRRWLDGVVDLSDFNYCYATAGATEAINQWRATDKRPWQMLRGDYQWPNLLTNDGDVVDEIVNDRVLYISNPQCANGNFLDNELIQSITCPVIYDCAYLGATVSTKVNLPTNTEQVMFSFSKGWGLIGQRCGLLYTKEPHPSLDLMYKVECWNYSTPLIIEKIIDKYGVGDMYAKFKHTQDTLCETHNLTPSDTYFIATSTDVYYSPQRRKGKDARLCLTPLIKK